MCRNNCNRLVNIIHVLVLLSSRLRHAISFRFLYRSISSIPVDNKDPWFLCTDVNCGVKSFYILDLINDFQSESVCRRRDSNPQPTGYRLNDLPLGHLAVAVNLYGGDFNFRSSKQTKQSFTSWFGQSYLPASAVVPEYKNIEFITTNPTMITFCIYS